MFIFIFYQSIWVLFEGEFSNRLYLFKFYNLNPKLVTSLRFGLSRLSESIFRRNIADCMNPSCPSSIEVKTIVPKNYEGIFDFCTS